MTRLQYTFMKRILDLLHVFIPVSNLSYMYVSLHKNLLFCIKYEAIDTVSVLYDQIAMHLNHNNNIRWITCECIVLHPM